MQNWPYQAIPWLAQARDQAWTCPVPVTDVLAFHRELDGYVPTPLTDLPEVAARLGVGRVVAKDESTRLGLGAFKGLGASWAVRMAVADRQGAAPLTVIAATDGNHGRAVARFARNLGHRASVYIPRGVHPTAVQNILEEGADLFRVDGTYDDAVAAACEAAETPGTVLVQDTAWEGYEDIPAAIIDGYDTLFREIDDQLDGLAVTGPALVVVPTGVGSLLHAALIHYRSRASHPGTAVVSVEPDTAACVQASLAEGTPVTVDTGTTIMAGLNCGTPSSAAWPFIINGLDAATTVNDTAATAAAHTLASYGVDAGPCGAASLAALEVILTGQEHTERRQHLHLAPDSVVVLLVTEGSSSNPVPSS
jgi:diaminopropionate ammonia-lyase